MSKKLLDFDSVTESNEKVHVTHRFVLKIDVYNIDIGFVYRSILNHVLDIGCPM